MDPRATARRFLEAVEAAQQSGEVEDWIEARDAASDLYDWLHRGGFAPELDHAETRDLWDAIEIVTSTLIETLT